MLAFNTTIVGQTIRLVSRNKLLKYPDERELPAKFAAQVQGQAPARPSSPDSERTAVGRQHALNGENEKGEDPNLVDWNGPDDPENPKNWSYAYKCWVTGLICLLTFSVYIGSSIYSQGIAGENSVMEVFNVSQTSALVGLTVFVAGYGVGPMILSPLSDVPQIGRNSIYMSTLFLFVVVQFPTIYAPNFQTLLAMRFLAGFFGSPALATGGATLADMYKPQHIAYSLGIWGCAAVCGPTMGPLLGGFVFQAKGWQWPLWVLTWLSGGCLIILAIFLPETSAENILYRRAVRLRKMTGNNNLKTQGEIESSETSWSDLASQTLVRPLVLFLEPIVLILNLYIALIYALLYIWFESFPLVFQEGHGFNPGETGLAFLGILVGVVGTMVCFCIYARRSLEPKFVASEDGTIKPEIRLKPACISAFCIPICLFWFGWTGQYPDRVHWILPIIGSGFFGVGAFLLFQTIFGYLTDSYPKDAASILAGNDLMRSAFGAAFPLFATATYHHLGIGGASSLLGGISCLFIPAPFILIKYGSRIRKHSKRASQAHMEDLKEN